MTAAMADRMAASSETWTSPSRLTMTSGGSPVCHIFSKTSLAVLPLIVPVSMRRIMWATWAAGTGMAAPASCSFVFRSTSVMTQFDAALALPLSRATDS